MAEAKKGLPIWAWFAIGCAGLVVLALIVILVVGMFVTKKVKDVAGDFKKNPEVAAARMIVKLNPDLEEVSVDEDAGTITVRDKKTGKVFTANVDDIKDGRFTIEGEDGKAVISTQSDKEGGTLKVTSDKGTVQFGSGDASKIPDWVPVFPGADMKSVFSMSTDGSVRGSAEIVTDKSKDEILAFYRKAMDDEGYQIQTSSYSGSDQSVDMITGTMADPKRNLMVNVSVDKDGEVKAAVTYSQGD